MAYNFDLYERTVVFAQRIVPQGVESFAKFADIKFIHSSKIFNNIDLNEVVYGDEKGPMSQSITFKDLNVRVIGHVDRLIILLLDPAKTDEHFYQASKRFADLLVSEDISAIGINFNSIIDTGSTKNAEVLVKEKILDKSGLTLFKGADAAAFRIMYEDEDKSAFFTISIDIGVLQPADSKERQGLLINCNYHREIKTKQLIKRKMDEFKNSLGDTLEKFQEYKQKIESFFNE